MTPEERAVENAAIAWAKANRTSFARAFTSTEKFPGEAEPVSLFMAGSPGAGKTETSKALMEVLGDFLRIDPDEFRLSIPGYDGSNSWLMQRAVSAILEKVLDCAFTQRQSFLLDGTLSNYEVAERNVSRCLKRDRAVQVIFVYQEPEMAWKFVCARELEEGRKIPPQRFVEQFFASREVVDRLKVKFSADIKIDVLLKNLDGSQRAYHANVQSLAAVAPLAYTRDQVEKLVITGR